MRWWVFLFGIVYISYAAFILVVPIRIGKISESDGAWGVLVHVTMIGRSGLLDMRAVGCKS